MPSTSPMPTGALRTDIVHLSNPHGVSMEERYFDIVDLNHFWVVRRYAVMQRLFQRRLNPALRYCEIGCGNGILQRQLEIRAGLTVDGVELCLPALLHNISSRGKLYYYNIFEQNPELQNRYDAIFMFDVIEHIDRDVEFVKAALFHLKPGGHLVISVPARTELFSKYDELAGHVRRYTLRSLLAVAQGAAADVVSASYWGLPLYPVLLTRKFLIRWMDDSTAYEKGFSPPGALANAALKLLSRIEWIPQSWLGTSAMAVLRKRV